MARHWYINVHFSLASDRLGLSSFPQLHVCRPLAPLRSRAARGVLLVPSLNI